MTTAAPFAATCRNARAVGSAGRFACGSHRPRLHPVIASRHHAWRWPGGAARKGASGAGPDPCARRRGTARLRFSEVRLSGLRRRIRRWLFVGIAKQPEWRPGTDDLPGDFVGDPGGSCGTRSGRSTRECGVAAPRVFRATARTDAGSDQSPPVLSVFWSQPSPKASLRACDWAPSNEVARVSR